MQAKSLQCSSSQVSTKNFIKIFREPPDGCFSELSIWTKQQTRRTQSKGWIRPWEEKNFTFHSAIVNIKDFSPRSNYPLHLPHKKKHKQYSNWLRLKEAKFYETIWNNLVSLTIMPLKFPDSVTNDDVIVVH